MFRQPTMLLIVTVVLGLIAAELLHAEEGPQVMFILDASGSMTEKSDGEPKITTAKKVMTKLLNSLDNDFQIGLTAYGHRQKGDCADIEILATPGQRDRATLVEEIEALQAKGKTPLSQSILTVAETLKTNEEPTTIVLISDGMETCGGDPCEVVKQLKASGVKFELHVVGFAVNAATRQQLDCVAGAGGGHYYDAQNATSLLESLQKASQEAVASFKRVQRSNVDGKTGLGILQVKMPKGSEVSVAHMTITRVHEQKQVLKINDPKATATYPLPAGKYDLAFGFRQPNFGKPITSHSATVQVRGKETRELQLGSISFNVPPVFTDGDLGERLAIEQIIIADAGTHKPVVVVHDRGNGWYNFKPKPVAAGIYDVLIKYATNTGSPAVACRQVSVEVGKDRVVALATGIQLKKSKAGLVAWKLVPSNSHVADSVEDGSASVLVKPTLEARAFASVSGSYHNLFYPYVVPAGRYDLHVQLRGMDEMLPVGEGIEIEEDKVLRFDTGL